MEPQVRLAIESRLDSIELAHAVVDESLARLRLSEEDRSSVGTALREAVVNAVRHGNRERAGKKVRIDVALEADNLRITVADEGDGFDPGAVLDPRTDENLLKPTGRGILLMRAFMDEIDYTFGRDGGTVVTLTKKVRSNPHTELEEEQA